MFAGFVFKDAFIDGADFWDGSIYFNENLIHALHNVPYWVKLTATFVMLIGLAIAWLAYIKDTTIPAKVPNSSARSTGSSTTSGISTNSTTTSSSSRLRLDATLKLGDVGTIDRFGPNGVAWVVEKGSVGAKKFQTGYLYSYALVMLLGLVAAVTWVLF